MSGKNKRERKGIRGTGEKSNWYRDSWEYIKESRKYIYFVMLIFFISGLFGFLFPSLFADQILELINELLDQTEGLNTVQLTWFIFFNNTKIALFGMVSGLTLIIPFIIMTINGYVLGFVANIVVTNSSILDLWRLLPHGLFELGAVFIALGMGVNVGMCYFIKRNAKKEFWRRFYASLKVFLCVVIPLLLIAAIIEGILIGLLG